MAQGKYVELSVAQRTEVWRRWKAGESLIGLGVLSTGRIPPFTVCCHITAGNADIQPSVCSRRSCGSEKGYLIHSVFWPVQGSPRRRNCKGGYVVVWRPGRSRKGNAGYRTAHSVGGTHLRREKGGIRDNVCDVASRAARFSQRFYSALTGQFR